jgi:hypothetical protein
MLVKDTVPDSGISFGQLFDPSLIHVGLKQAIIALIEAEEQPFDRRVEFTADASNNTHGNHESKFVLAFGDEDEDSERIDMGSGDEKLSEVRFIDLTFGGFDNSEADQMESDDEGLEHFRNDEDIETNDTSRTEEMDWDNGSSDLE